MDANSSKSIFFATPEVSPPATVRPLALRRMAVTSEVSAPVSNERPLIAILDRPLGKGELASIGFARKEHDLGAAFAKLTVLEARRLHARLTINAPDDVLAARFAQLTVDRRDRLLHFLADARRREALGASKGC
jgi:hypothetical protein